MAGNNADIVRRLFELAAAGDIDGYAAHVDPDAELHPLVGDRVYRGPEGLREYFSRLSSADTRIETSAFRFEERGDAVLVPGRIRVRAGGALTDNQVYWVLELRDGKLVRTASFRTAEEAEAAIG